MPAAAVQPPGTVSGGGLVHGGGLPQINYLTNPVITINGDVFDPPGTRLCDYLQRPRDDWILPIQPSRQTAFNSIAIPSGLFRLRNPTPSLADQQAIDYHLANYIAGMANVQVSYPNVSIDYDSLNPPQVNLALQSAQSITLGDLHGNTLTLLQIVIQMGMLTVPQADYQSMRSIILQACDHPQAPIKDPSSNFNLPLSSQQYDAFLRNLENCSVNSACPKLRLIGDTVGDRMSNDLLTFILIGYLVSRFPAEIGFRIVIIFSNHDSNVANFLSYNSFRWTQFNPRVNPCDSMRRFTAFLRDYLQPSDLRAPALLSAIRYWTLSLRLYDFELIPFSGSHKCCIFSHASLHPRIALEACKRILSIRSIYIPEQSLGDFTFNQLVALLVTTNSILQEIFQELSINWDNIYNQTNLFNQNAPAIHIYGQLFNDQFDPATNNFCYPHLAIWLRLRNHHDVNYPCSWQFSLPNLSAPDGYEIFNIHGHDVCTRNGDVSLDNDVGKSNDLMQGTHQLQVCRIGIP